MNRVRLWILPAAVVVLLVVATFFLTVTEAGRGLVGLATGAASCDVLAPDTPVTGTLSAESVFDCYKFLADGTTYGADDITLRLISKSKHSIIGFPECGRHTRLVQFSFVK